MNTQDENKLYAMMGDADEQFSFISCFVGFCEDSFNQTDVEVGQCEGGSCLCNQAAISSVVEFEGKFIKVSPSDLGFLITYRMSLIKQKNQLSKHLCQCAKKLLTPEFFDGFFVVVNWETPSLLQKINVVIE